jgi:hypothetical protein
LKYFTLICYLHELVRSQLYKVWFEVLFHHLVRIGAVEEVNTHEDRNRRLSPVLVQYGGGSERHFLNTTPKPLKLQANKRENFQNNLWSVLLLTLRTV